MSIYILADTLHYEPTVEDELLAYSFALVSNEDKIPIRCVSRNSLLYFSYRHTIALF